MKDTVYMVYGSIFGPELIGVATSAAEAKKMIERQKKFAKGCAWYVRCKTNTVPQRFIKQKKRIGKPPVRY